jgi:CRP-like cAMP-binding protein
MPKDSHGARRDALGGPSGVTGIRPREAEVERFAALEETAASVILQRDEALYAEGDPADHSYRVVEGGIRLVVLLSGGDRVVTDFYLPGDFFGYVDAAERFGSAQALSGTILRRYRRTDVSALAAADANLWSYLAEATTEAMRASRRHLIRISHASAPVRLASFLLEMADRSRTTDGRIYLPMPRADIADHLGLVVETLSRSLRKLEQARLIALDRTNCVKILDRRALHALAGGREDDGPPRKRGRARTIEVAPGSSGRKGVRPRKSEA